MYFSASPISCQRFVALNLNFIISTTTTRHVAVVQEFHWSMVRPPSDPSYVIVACDATRDRNEHDIKLVIGNVRANGVILSPGDRLLVLCVLHKVSHPSKFYEFNLYALLVCYCSIF